MKYPLLLLFLIILSGVTRAQEYTLETSQEDYTYLDKAVVVMGEGEDWDDPVIPVNIGFEFNFLEDTFEQLFISDDISFSTEGDDYVDAVYIDFVDRNEASRISTQTDEVNGFKVFKIEWRNVGIYQEEEDNGTTNDSLNVQVWLYEGSNDIEIHVGPNSISPDLYGWDTGAYVWIW